MEIISLCLIKRNPCKGKWYCRHACGNVTQHADNAKSSHISCVFEIQPSRFSASFPDLQCLMQGNVWVMDFHNRPLMIFPSPKSALWSFSSSTLIFLNWKKIYYSFPPSWLSFPFGWHGLPSLLPSCISHVFSRNRKL